MCCALLFRLAAASPRSIRSVNAVRPSKRRLIGFGCLCCRCALSAALCLCVSVETLAFHSLSSLPYSYSTHLSASPSHLISSTFTRRLSCTSSRSLHRLLSKIHDATHINQRQADIALKQLLVYRSYDTLFESITSLLLEPIRIYTSLHLCAYCFPGCRTSASRRSTISQHLWTFVGQSA